VRFAALACALTLMIASITAHAHSGGLDARGCHANRKTGDYHCHRSAAPAPPMSREPTSSPPRFATAPQHSGVIKKSRSGICHAPGTEYYDRTMVYTAFTTLYECLASGGRLPR
jgi:hypothetical protein